MMYGEEGGVETKDATAHPRGRPIKAMRQQISVPGATTPDQVPGRRTTRAEGKISSTSARSGLWEASGVLSA